MDKFELVGYTCLGALAALYIIAMIVGMIAVGPIGILGFVALIGIGALVLKVLRERLNSPEDDYYSDNIEK